MTASAIRLSALSLLIFIVLPAVGCDSAAPPEAGTFDARFTPKDPLKSDSVTRMRVERRGETKEALVLRAPSAVSASIGECREPCVFRASIAPVFNVGDGFEMNVWLSDGKGSQKIYSRCIDAGRRFEDRSWIPIRIPIEFRTGDARLEIQVTGGPLGDLTADWLALAEMRISSEAK